jgi:peptide deformylase
MSILPILKYPDPVLRKISTEVTEVDDNVRQLARKMAESMYAAEGAGLAAIQVGEPIRMFIVDSVLAGGEPQDPPLVFINPEVILTEGEQEGDEGCLSFPGIFVPVVRAEKCTVRATNLDGKEFEMTGEGILARAFQHETDHLDARLLIDFVGRIKKRFIEKKMRREEGEGEAEQQT